LFVKIFNWSLKYAISACFHQFHRAFSDLTGKSATSFKNHARAAAYFSNLKDFKRNSRLFISLVKLTFYGLIRVPRN